MTTAWSHLPNAGHIDRILADVRANPGNWAYSAAWDRVKAAAWDAAWDAARSAAWDAAWDAARSTVRSAVSSAAWAAAWTTVLALIAWDEAGDYLSLPADQVQVLAALGDNKAVLMLPAAIAFDQQKEIT